MFLELQIPFINSKCVTILIFNNSMEKNTSQGTVRVYLTCGSLVKCFLKVLLWGFSWGKKGLWRCQRRNKEKQKQMPVT